MISWLLSSLGLKALNELVSLAVLERNIAVSTGSTRVTRQRSIAFGDHCQPDPWSSSVCFLFLVIKITCVLENLKIPKSKDKK